MSPARSPRLHVRLAAAAAGTALAGLALVATPSSPAAAKPTVSLSLVGTRAQQALKCSKGEAHADRYSKVQRGVAVTLVGSVRPAPAVGPWHARVTVKRCVAGHFTGVWMRRATGGKAGTFRVTYTPRSRGLFVAIADYGRRPKVQSPKLRLVTG